MMHSHMARLTALLLAAAGVVWAHANGGEGSSRAPLPEPRVYLQISPDGREDLEALFHALEESVAAGEPQVEPVVIVLYGAEALPFIRSNYAQHQALVDRAAKLRAFDRIELRMCETWMRLNGFGEDDLLPFVDTVPFAPAEVERLEKDDYVPYRPRAPRSGLL